MRPSKPTQPIAATSPSVDALSIPGVLTVQLEAWLKDQVELMEGMEGTLQAWLKRRREASESTLRAVRQLSGCTDMNAAATIYQEWVTGNVDRLLADVAATRQQTMRVMGRAATARAAANGHHADKPDAVE